MVLPALGFRSNDAARSYGNQVKSVVDQFDLGLVDTWALLEGNSPSKSRYLSDGLHLNEKGNRAVYLGLKSALLQKYPEVLPMEDGQGKYGKSGVPLEEELWRKALGD